MDNEIELHPQQEYTSSGNRKASRALNTALTEGDAESSDGLSARDQKIREGKAKVFTLFWSWAMGLYFGARLTETGGDNLKSSGYCMTKTGIRLPFPIFWVSLTTTIFIIVAVISANVDSQVDSETLDILHVTSYLARAIITVYNLIFGVMMISNRSFAKMLEKSDANMVEVEEVKEPRKIVNMLTDPRTKPETLDLIDKLTSIIITMTIFNVGFFALFQIFVSIGNGTPSKQITTFGGPEVHALFLLCYTYSEAIFLFTNVFLSLAFVLKLWGYFSTTRLKVMDLMESRKTVTLVGGDFAESAQQVKTTIFEYLETVEYINETWKWFHMTRVTFGTLVVADLASSFYTAIHAGSGVSTDVSIAFYLFVFVFLFVTLWLTVFAAGIGNEWFYDLMQELSTENEMMPESDKQKGELRYFLTAILLGRDNVGYKMFFTYVTAEKAITLITLVMFVINYTLSLRNGGDG